MPSSLPSRGYGVIVEPGKETIEFETFTCNHNNEMIRVRPGMVNQAPFCLKCSKPICNRCYAEAMKTGECVTFEQRLDKVERLYEFEQAILRAG